MIRDKKEEEIAGQFKFCIYMWNKDVENKTRILYNYTIKTNWIERDVAQLGSAFVLGTKCHGFKSCHPYLITFTLRSKEEFIEILIKIGHTQSLIFFMILYMIDSVCMQDVDRVFSYKKPFFPVFLIYWDKKALLVQFGRTWVSKTRCRRFKSYRAWFHILLGQFELSN